MSETQPRITQMRLQDALAQGILQADPANANKGTERGEYMITQSLQRTGVGRGIVVDAKGYIVAGNKTTQAAAELGDDVEVIIIETDGKQLVVTRRTDFDLTDPSPTNIARQAAYSDNRASEVSLQWDFEQIGQDLLAGMDLSDWFHDDEIQAMLNDTLIIGGESGDTGSDNYSREIKPPLYEPSGDKPDIAQLYDDSRTRALIDEIERMAHLTDDERAFLIAAAHRHTILHFSKIANFYAHSQADVQRLMENSALVIIDFNRAIELGFVKLSKRLLELAGLDDNEE